MNEGTAKQSYTDAEGLYHPAEGMVNGHRTFGPRTGEEHYQDYVQMSVWFDGCRRNEELARRYREALVRILSERTPESFAAALDVLIEAGPHAP